MKKVFLILLACGFLAGCNGGPEPKPEQPWIQYVHEVEDFAAWFGEGRDFWYTTGTVAANGECLLDDTPETWDYGAITLSTSTTGQWERIYAVAELAGDRFFAEPTQGVWVSSSYSGQICYVAWEEPQ